MPTLLLTAVFFTICVALVWRSLKSLALPQTTNQATSPKVSPKVTTTLEYASRLYGERKYLAAEKAYLEVLKLDHKNIGAYTRLGRIYLWLKNFPDAIECYQITVRLNPSASAYFNLGTAWYESQDYAKAITAFNQAITLEPTAPRFSALAKAYQRQSDWVKAARALEQAVDLDPSLQHKNLLLSAYRSAGEIDKARSLQAQLAKMKSRSL